MADCLIRTVNGKLGYRPCCIYANCHIDPIDVPKSLKSQISEHDANYASEILEKSHASKDVRDVVRIPQNPTAARGTGTALICKGHQRQPTNDNLILHPHLHCIRSQCIQQRMQTGFSAAKNRLARAYAEQLARTQIGTWPLLASSCRLA